MQEKETEKTEVQDRPDGNFTMKIGRTTYRIGLHFSKTSKESLDDKVKRLIKQDVTTENF